MNAEHVERKSAAASGGAVPSPSPSPPEVVSESVAYPGPVGSHTASAAAALFPSAELVPLAGFRAVADAVASADAEHGVLPIESSLVGPVAETHDLLYEAPLSIVSEVTLPIVHCLVARSPIQVSEVRTLRSNPVAFDQCRELVHASGARWVYIQNRPSSGSACMPVRDLALLHAAADQEPVGNFSVKSLGSMAGRDHKGMVRVS